MKSGISISTMTVLLAVGVGAVAQERLLIISPDGFMDELQTLKEFKSCSGRPTILLSLSEVCSAFSGVDDAEDVKLCIAHHHTLDGVEFVLLVGDVDKFPARYRWFGRPGQENWCVSDLYYADLFKEGSATFDDWDSNANLLYGEIEFLPDGNVNNDTIDFLPDVSVGRIPASTEEDVEAYVEKIISYEMKTTPSAVWFKKAALYTGNWPSNGGGDAKKDQIGSHLSSLGFALIKRYWDWGNNQPPPGTPQVMIDDINSGTGFVNYLGHGEPGSWVSLTFGYSDVGALTNVDKLPVVFGGCCDTGMFSRMPLMQPYQDTEGACHCGYDSPYVEQVNLGPYPHPALPRPACIQDATVDCFNQQTQQWDMDIPMDRTCFAESMALGNPVGPTGAVAYLGARSGANVGMLDLDQHFFEGYEPGTREILGDIWKHMIETYYAQHDLDDSPTWSCDPSEWTPAQIFDEPQRLILFGDPSLVVGGAFSTAVSGTAYDGNGGPFASYSRYRITGDVTVPVGQTLNAYPATSLLFEDDLKLTALGTTDGEGLVMSGSQGLPVTLMSLASDPQSLHVIHGMKVCAEAKVKNGGQIKLY